MTEIDENFLLQLEEPNEDVNIELSDESDDEYKEQDIIENYIEKDIFQIYHPQIKQINNQELQHLIKITRNEDGLINDENHKTIPILTRYEKSKIIGLRAKQINSGSELFIKASSNIIDGITLATMELKQKKIPFIIRRPLPDGTNEYWNINDLSIIE
jgi:DNA-directed RNA polymerases I, II, and III subunit RPABC2